MPYRHEKETHWAECRLEWALLVQNHQLCQLLTTKAVGFLEVIVLGGRNISLPLHWYTLLITALKEKRGMA